MRASLRKAARARHDLGCRFAKEVNEKGNYIFLCTPTCAIAALGGGNSGEGVGISILAERAVDIKRENRRRLMIRKKRRGWI